MKSLYESILSSTNAGKTGLIRAWLDEHNIKNYTINSKGEIDVDWNVNLIKCGLTEFPSFIQFGTVKGNFNCSFNNLTSLRGGPKEVCGKFYCIGNLLTSLEGAPKKIGGDFECSYNKLTSLKGAPKEVGGSFDCSFNNLISLEGAPNVVNRYFDCSFNNLTSLRGAPKEVGRAFDCNNNNLTTLEGAPIEAKFFTCEKNTTKFSKDDVRKVCKVKKSIYV